MRCVRWPTRAHVHMPTRRTGTIPRKPVCAQPQRIQISQHTRDKLKHLPFDVTEKGHVELQVCSYSV